MNWHLLFGLLLLLSVSLRSPAFESWPKKIEALVGGVGICMDASRFWTLRRIDYKGSPLGVDFVGSYYGTVAKIKSIGFVGSGHRENEDEKVDSVALSVDGVDIPFPDAKYTCNSFRLRKRSRMKSIEMNSEVFISDDVMVESVDVWSERGASVDFIYHFMHPWSLLFGDYCARLCDGDLVSGSFAGDNQFKVNDRFVWTAVFDRGRKIGIVTWIVMSRSGGENYFIKYWDKADRYRKFYFQSLTGASMVPGHHYRYSIMTAPYFSDDSNWMADAEKMANHGLSADRGGDCNGAP